MKKSTKIDAYAANAPMWSDFDSISNISEDYFDFSHSENETPFPDAPETLRGKSNVFSNPTLHIDEIEKTKFHSTLTLQLTTNFMETLDTINMTPVKVVSPKSKKGESVIAKETTVGDVLNDVIDIATSVSKQKRKTLNLNKSQGIVLEPTTTPPKPKRTTRSMYTSEAKKTLSVKPIPNLRKSIAQNVTSAKSLSNNDDSIKNDAGVPISKIIRTPILKLTKTHYQVTQSQNTVIDHVEDVLTSVETINDNETQEVDKDETIKLEVPKLYPKSQRALIASTPAEKSVHSNIPISPNEKSSPSKGSSTKCSKTEIFPPTSDKPQIISIDNEKAEDDDEYKEALQPIEDFEQYQVQKACFVEKRKANHKPSVLTSHARRRSSIMKNRRQSNRYVSLAEAIVKFQKGTPTRFRTVSTKNPRPKCLQSVKQQVRKPVIPVSPALSLKNRVRRNVVLSHAEREEIEIQKIKQHPIRANPVPKSILQGPQTLKAVPKKPLTTQHPFHLGIAKECNVKKEHPISSRASAHELQVSLKKPMRKTVPIVVSSDNCVTISETEIIHFGIPGVSAQAVGSARKKKTQLLPFNFEQRNRLFMSKKEERLKKLQIQEELKAKSEFHARPMPLSLKKTPQKEAKEIDPKNKHEMTKSRVLPFSFEERNQRIFKKKEELRKKIEEEEKKARIFHANPVPQFKPVMVRGISRKNLKNEEKKLSTGILRTRSRENLETDDKRPSEIHNKSVDTRKTPLKPTTRGHSVENLKILQANSRDNLKTKPLRKLSAPNLSDYDGNINDENKPPTNHKPIQEIFNKSNMPVLKPKLKNIELHSEERAKYRREYDKQLKVMMLLEEDKRRKEHEEKVAREQAEINLLRKKAEIKARPMPVYKPMTIVKSTKPLTVPESPTWSHKR